MKSWLSWMRTLLGYGPLVLLVNFGGGPVQAAEPVTILAFGDSLTAGFNLAPQDAFPVKLEAALQARGYTVRVINAGVSGDTTAAARARLDWVLADKPDYAIVELGANDALRGLDPKLALANLDAILATLRQRGIGVLLAGMVAPRNLGTDYAKSFDPIYRQLAAKYHVPLYPFFLDGVALHSDLTQADGLHPTPPGVDRIVQGILPQVEALIAQRQGARQ